METHPIVDEAALIAQQSGASIKIVDVVPEFPWIVRLSLNDLQAIRETVSRDKRERLFALAEPLRQRGIHVDTEVLSGRTSIEIIRQVSRGDHDLVLRVAKGKDSRRGGFFGTTATRLFRECPCPIWLVAAAASPSYKHVMACVDTSNDEPADVELNDLVLMPRLESVNVTNPNSPSFMRGRFMAKNSCSVERNRKTSETWLPTYVSEARRCSMDS